MDTEMEYGSSAITFTSLIHIFNNMACVYNVNIYYAVHYGFTSVNIVQKSLLFTFFF